jgi:hypothetical protein
VALLAAACGGSDEGAGACRYGERVDAGIVVVRAISEPTGTGESAIHEVEVAGLLDGVVAVPSAAFDACFTAAGIRVGSEVDARVIAGGPCPPLVQLAECPAGRILR